VIDARFAFFDKLDNGLVVSARRYSEYSGQLLAGG
jgi:hypothetical protein